MLYDLYCEESNKIFRSWNTAAKLVWSVPRGTFTFLVEQVLTGDLTSVRADILTRYASFLQCLTRSSSREIRILASTAVSDGRCTTGSNASKLAREAR